MSWTSLMVVLDTGPDSGRRLALAVELAHALKARLIGVAGIVSTPPVMTDPWFGGGLSAEVLETFRGLADEELAGLAVAFAGATAGLSAEWRGQIGHPAEVVTRESRAADVIIMGRRSALCDSRAPDPGDVLLAAGRPVLVVPPQPARAPLAAPVVLAWSEQAEARRAAALALPLLRHTGPVAVTAVVSEAEPGPAGWRPVCDVADWLGGHGLTAEAEVRSSLQEVADELLDAAAQAAAGLIVAGGYGHSRLREQVLGGVTRALLAEGDVCVLLAH